MYNRYVRNDAGQYQRIPVQDTQPPCSPTDRGGTESGAPPPDFGPEPDSGPGGFPPPDFGGQDRRGGSAPPHGGKKGILSGILDKLNLKDIDTGDLLLLVLIFLLFRESEDDELLIALGLLLIL